MGLLLRNTVRVLLINEENEVLLLCADDPKTTTIDGEYHGRYWFPLGGKIEMYESIQQAALREIYEESGISREEVELGAVVWYG